MGHFRTARLIISLLLFSGMLALPGGASLAHQEAPSDEEPGLRSSMASAINDHGQIVGISITFIGGFMNMFETAALWENEVMLELGSLPGGEQSEATDINNAGQIVGSVQLADGTWHAVLWDGTQIVTLGALTGTDSSMAQAINDAGQIVGWSGSASGEDAHAVLWQEGETIDLGTLPGGAWSVAMDINEAGQIVGQAHTEGSNVHAVLWEKGQITDLGAFPGDALSVASAVNDAGQVVGGSGSASGEMRAALWEKGAIFELGTPAAYEIGLSYAEDINAAGEIAGYAVMADNGASDAIRWRWQGGATTSIDLLPPTSLSMASGINASGQIVGRVLSVEQGWTAMLWENGGLIDLGAWPVSPSAAAHS